MLVQSLFRFFWVRYFSISISLTMEDGNPFKKSNGVVISRTEETVFYVLMYQGGKIPSWTMLAAWVHLSLS